MTKKRVSVLLFVTVFVGISFTVSYLGAENIVAYVGSENALILMFILGLVGGITTFSGIPYHVVLMSFTAGGLSPVLLGVTTAFGVMMGDSLMYTVSKNAVTLLSNSTQKRLLAVSAMINKKPRLMTPLLMIYGLCSPFSNDFIVASLAATGYSYWRIIVPLTIGNIGYNIALGYLGYYAYDWIVSIVG